MDMSSDYVVAMNAPQYDSYDWCNVEIDIQYKGKTVKAKVVDRVRRFTSHRSLKSDMLSQCEACPSGALDLTKGLFGALDDVSAGVIDANWVRVKN